MAEDKLILGYKIMVYVRPDGTRYIKTKNKSDGSNDQDLALLSMYLDKAKQDIMEGFTNDVELEQVSEGLFDT